MTPALARRVCLALCPSHVFNKIEYAAKFNTELDDESIQIGPKFTLDEIATARLDRVHISWDIARSCMMGVNGASANINAIMKWLVVENCITQDIEG